LKGTSYRDRDYAFGQAMLSLRTRIGLTQTGLADFLGVSRRTVGDWEAGSSYPKAGHLKRFVALAIQHQAFPAGHEADEVRSLWQAAHQKVLIDEAWLEALRSSDRGWYRRSLHHR
jgi:transcriptional regulator with XRE-family HTH domain